MARTLLRDPLRDASAKQNGPIICNPSAIVSAIQGGYDASQSKQYRKPPVESPEICVE
jgi:hypothetical protein